MKKIFALLLLVCMVFTLCACDSGNANAGQENNETQESTTPDPGKTDEGENPSTPPVSEPADSEPEGTQPSYTIKVVDEGGNPVPNTMVQLCSDMCIPAMTNANGVAMFAGQPVRSDYKASVTIYPEGYEAAGEQTEFYFEDSFEVTITIKKSASGGIYTIKVVDEGGNPVPNTMVQLCADMCIPKMTDENGVAAFENQEARSDYKASVTVYPEGYEAAGEQTDFYFEDGYEVTIVLKAVA